MSLRCTNNEFLLAGLQGSKVTLHAADAEDPDISSDLALLPDTETLADRPKPCLAEVQELPRDWARLFDGQLYGLGEQSWGQTMHEVSCHHLHVVSQLQLAPLDVAAAAATTNVCVSYISAGSSRANGMLPTTCCCCL
jgi:hypothetical protein